MSDKARYVHFYKDEEEGGILFQPDTDKINCKKHWYDFEKGEEIDREPIAQYPLGGWTENERAMEIVEQKLTEEYEGFDEFREAECEKPEYKKGESQN